MRSLVELHGGTVAARSDGLGTGSEFIVSPAAAPDARTPAPARAAAPAPQRERARRGGARVLIVDDNEDAAELLAEALQRRGLRRARRARRAGGARAWRRTFTPDVALLDIGLPVMDGYELARTAAAAARPRRSSAWSR